MSSANSDLLRYIQSHVARGAITPSLARGRGRKGTIAKARSFLRQLDLRPFGTTVAATFSDRLDQRTAELLRHFPPSAKQWGLARKALNVFLRDCLYNFYLRRANRLDKAEGLFELPLDSITGTLIRREVGPRRLPPWRGLRGIDRQANAVYQALAADAARTYGIHRVHLDAYWWSVSRDSDAA